MLSLGQRSSFRTVVCDLISDDLSQEIMKTGGMNKTFLYFTADSGRLPSGQISRQGDTHNQVLPRGVARCLARENGGLEGVQLLSSKRNLHRLEARLTY